MPQRKPCHGVDNDIRYDDYRGYKKAIPKVAKKGDPIVYVYVEKQVGILRNERGGICVQNFPGQACFHHPVKWDYHDEREGY